MNEVLHVSNDDYCDNNKETTLKEWIDISFEKSKETKASTLIFDYEQHHNVSQTLFSSTRMML